MHLLVYLSCLPTLESQFHEGRDFALFTAVTPVLRTVPAAYSQIRKMGLRRDDKSLPRDFCNLKQKVGGVVSAGRDKQEGIQRPPNLSWVPRNSWGKPGHTA